jgi:hypothetical protein
MLSLLPFSQLSSLCLYSTRAKNNHRSSPHVVLGCADGSCLAGHDSGGLLARDLGNIVCTYLQSRACQKNTHLVTNEVVIPLSCCLLCPAEGRVGKSFSNVTLVCVARPEKGTSQGKETYIIRCWGLRPQYYVASDELWRGSEVKLHEGVCIYLDVTV